MEKMKKNIRPYGPADRPKLTRLIAQLQEHIAALDPHHRQKSGRDFDADAYMENTMKKIRKSRGTIFVAEVESEIVGCIIGCIPSPSENDFLECYPIEEGCILELIVSENSRGSGVGSELMQVMENYFIKAGCKFSRVACFAPNIEAHGFYKKCGYENRTIDMLKNLRVTLGGKI